jgi:hypothetical protein
VFQGRSTGGVVVVTIMSIILVAFVANLAVSLLGGPTIQQIGKALADILTGAAT